MKELNNINLNDTISLRLPQSKLYLKFLHILDFIDNTNLSVIPDIIKRVIKTTYIFDNIVLASYSYIIKAFSKSNITVIQVKIWDSQNSMKAKLLIKRYFNIEHSITTIRGTNMNPSILQYKDCWKWDYTMYMCCLYRSKCKKCNSLHKLELYREIV